VANHFSASNKLEVVVTGGVIYPRLGVLVLGPPDRGLEPFHQGLQELGYVEGKTITLVYRFAEGKADAFLGFPPKPQQMRARKIGHVIVDTGADRPWSQYFCCMIAGNSEFVRRNPVATKRAVRAILNASDICAREPTRAARYLVDKGYEKQYDVALEVIKSLPYDRWRQTEPEDTVRFHALRLRELGMIKSSPQKIIAQGTDWRFLNAIRKELKG